MPFSWIFSVVLGLPRPPSNIRPEGEDQLEWSYLKMIIIINTELTRKVGNICIDYYTFFFYFDPFPKITLPLAG